MNTTTDTLTPVQRLETRRGILQTVGEMSRGLKVLSGLLKMGQFGNARDQIAGTEAMLALHEGLAIGLLKENTRLHKLILDADSMLAERAVTLDGTAGKMIEQGMLPKSQRSEDFDRDDMLRYNAYAGEAQAALGRFRSIIAGQA